MLCKICYYFLLADAAQWCRVFWDSCQDFDDTDVCVMFRMEWKMENLSEVCAKTSQTWQNCQSWCKLFVFVCGVKTLKLGAYAPPSRDQAFLCHVWALLCCLSDTQNQAAQHGSSLQTRGQQPAGERSRAQRALPHETQGEAESSLGRAIRGKRWACREDGYQLIVLSHLSASP